MKILFVNACMRGPEHSRTWKLCQAFLDACRARWPQAQITERDLTACDWPVLSAALDAERTALQNEFASLKGLFSGKRRKEIEVRLAAITKELEE